MKSLLIILVAATVTALVYSEEAVEPKEVDIQARWFRHRWWNRGGGFERPNCAAVNCPVNTTCTRNLFFGLQCVPAVAVPTRTTCAMVRCTANTTCIEELQGARCAPIIPGRVTCTMVTSCGVNATCLDRFFGPQCIPNATLAIWLRFRGFT